MALRLARAGKEIKMIAAMTDKQMEVILNLVADKFDGCQTMEDVKKAVKQVRDMAKSEHS